MFGMWKSNSGGKMNLYLKARILFGIYKLNLHYSITKNRFNLHTAKLEAVYPDDHDNETCAIFSKNSDILMAIIDYGDESIFWCTEDPKVKKAINKYYVENIESFFTRFEWIAWNQFKLIPEYEEETIFIADDNLIYEWDIYTKTFKDVEINSWNYYDD